VSNTLNDYDLVRHIVAQRVQRMNGKISSKRLFPVARAAGYADSVRSPV
jgi:hypothetical protein